MDGDSKADVWETSGGLLSKWEMVAAWEGDGKKRHHSVICKMYH